MSTPADLTVKGCHGFVFEFKFRSDGLKFIRYQPGDREFSRAGLVPTWLRAGDVAGQQAMVAEHLRGYAGAGQRVVAAAQKLVAGGLKIVDNKC